jgi:hypothetical protein
MSCCCSLPPECCAGCANNRFPGLVGPIVYGPINHHPPIPVFEFTEDGSRKLQWAFTGGGRLIKEPCVYFHNIDRGLECTAQNCPCELYEVES